MGAARRHGVGAAYQINLAAGALPAQSRRGLDHQMHLLQISRFRIVSMWVHLERLFMNTHRWHAPRKEPLLKIAEMPHHRTAKPARRICTLDSGASSSLEMTPTMSSGLAVQLEWKIGKGSVSSHSSTIPIK